MGARVCSMPTFATPMRAWVMIAFVALAAGHAHIPQAIFSAKSAADWQPTSGKCGGTFTAPNNVITGIKSYKGMTFITVPRWRSGVPSTLNVLEGSTAGNWSLRAWPDCASQNISNASALQFVQSVEIDPVKGEMWVLDVGRRNWWTPGCHSHTGRRAHHCPDGTPPMAAATNAQPKMRIYNIASKQQVGSDYIFPTDVALPGKSNTDDLVIDLTNQVAFIADTSGAIILFDRKNNKSRRVELSGFTTSVKPSVGGMYFKVSNGQVNNSLPGVTNIVNGIDGIALTPDMCTPYFTPIVGHHLYSVPTYLLRDFTITDMATITKAVKDHGVRPGGIMDGMTFGNDGNLYFGGIRDSSINVWNPALPLSTASVIWSTGGQPEAQNTQQWPAAFTFGQPGELLFTTNK